ncbi:hypothetical protein NMY22_g11 [Coprinellus aureogranulatus]|nr:hypothetical protein NMY22_g11 [Coprinellus aureogranulatus]
MNPSWEPTEIRTGCISDSIRPGSRITVPVLAITARSRGCMGPRKIYEPDLSLALFTGAQENMNPQRYTQHPWFGDDAELGYSNYERTESAQGPPDIALCRTSSFDEPQFANSLQAEDIDALEDTGVELARLFDMTGDLGSINQAISVLNRAIELTPEGHTGFPRRLTNLGNCLLLRFERIGNLSDVDSAISAQRRAVELAPEGSASLPCQLNNLGASLQARFEYTYDPSDLTEAISVQQRAVQLTPDDHVDMPSRLSNLGNSLHIRFEHTCDPADISEAISAQQRALQLTPETHVDFPCFLNNLGSSFTSRFQNTSDPSDISSAIEALQRAVQLTPEGHADLPHRLHNLGTSFACRFERTDNLLDISSAIEALQRAIQLTPDGHADLPNWLNSVGNSFLRRFECFGKLSCITEAIAAHRRAIGLTPDDHSNLPLWLNNLGHSLQRRCEQTGDRADIADAISALKRAMQLIPKNHEGLPDILSNLGKALRLHSRITGSDEDINDSISTYKLAATSITGTPRSRLIAARRWVQLLYKQDHQSPDIWVAFDIALSLVTLVAGLEQTVQTRHRLLQDQSGLALEAASMACSLGRADKALEWLEQGRCLIWNQMNNLRTPLDELRIHDEQLAERVLDVAKKLETAGSSRTQSHSSMSLPEKIMVEYDARAHLSLARDWERCRDDRAPERAVIILLPSRSVLTNRY